ncbi:GNAT family N-acetyltransferase [Myroides pelagicus]|uniref:GNAT family N-acetyltransferase n=1 Tax=Myroides pelagicus TaxID=270914 RepID=A0A7K1GQH9_9FLAO|nr:GNAT family protein [Myroides pelagicus]MEC4113603.1 GNAT family protein [Myroides pelagicus]MTH30623.1 GNAT family N-acetyltransferase [Myroides pelagicus]
MSEVILTNDRVVLRPLEYRDIETLLRFSISEPDIWDYTPTTGAGKENLEKYINKAIQDREAETAIPFVVFDKKVEQYVGSTRLCDINHVQKKLIIGYTWYGQEFRGTGLNKHCKYLLLQYAFETLAMERVEFRADNTNARSIAAMKSIGCTLEGVLRSDVIMRDGRRRDTAVLSILRDEWFLYVKEQLLSKL